MEGEEAVWSCSNKWKLCPEILTKEITEKTMFENVVIVVSLKQKVAPILMVGGGQEHTVLAT